MKELWLYIQAFFTVVGGFLGWFLGGIDGFIYALVAFVVLDYITGVMLAILENKLSSDIGFRGIFKKVLIFTLVGIGHIIDSQVIGDGGVIRTAVIFFYLSNEGVSVLENASKIGLPIPEKLKDILAQLRDKEDSIK
ncbi:MAG TPA: phage holin family protein [Atribacterota bacterium]|nr:phage holin family protein [Atribacterota bacterium]